MDSIQLQVDKLFLDTVGGIEILNHYASDEEAEEVEETAGTGNPEADQEEDLAANGMLVLARTDVETELEGMMLEAFPDLCQPDDDPDAEDVFCLGLVLPEETDKNEVEIEVAIDESGNLIAACPEIELVSEKDAHPEEGEVSVGLPDAYKQSLTFTVYKSMSHQGILMTSIIFYLNGSHYLLFDWISESHPPCLPRAGKTIRYLESEAWKELHDQGLSSTPRMFGVVKCGLCYNRHGQWLGLYPGKPTVGRSFHPGLRSERKALLQVLIALWRSYAIEIGEEKAHETLVQDIPLLEYTELLCDEQAACVL